MLIGEHLDPGVKAFSIFETVSSRSMGTGK